jgi:hypothetical protein
MRPLVALALAAVITAPTPARPDDKTARYGVALDAKAYPQATAKEALASVLKAIEAKKFNYLVAHLADPGFVDDRVKRIYGGKFDEQVQDTKARLDPVTVKQLKRFLKDGEWDVGHTSAAVTLKDVKDRVVRLTKKGGRWYLKHDFTPK